MSAHEQPATDMSPEEFRRQGYQVVDWIADYLAHPERYPVLARTEPGVLRRALPAEPPAQGEPMAAILADFTRHIIPGITHWNHPAFFAYFAISGSAAGILGELLSAALNVNGMLWKTSPAATELEEVALDWLRQMVGLPPQFGIIMDTASVASLCAIAAAREAAGDAVRRAFSLVPEYLRTAEAEQAAVRDFMDYGIQLGRRFRALKLWMVIRYFGGEGLAARIREHIRLGHLFASWVDAHPDFERLAPTPFSVVCFRARPTDLPVGPEGERDAYLDALNERLLDAVNATGRAYLSHTRLRGRFALRLAVGNLRTTEAHVQTAWDLLQEHAARLHAAGRGGAQEKAEAPWKG